MAAHFKEWPEKPGNLVLEEKEKGQGSYGRVYIGKLAGNPVAVKVIYPNLLRATGNDHLLLGFKEECAKLQSLKHDRIVKLLGTFWDKSLGPLLVMEMLDQNLEEFLRDHSKPGSLPLIQQLEIVKELTEGLRYLHSHNIVHRDLKPANILIGKDGHLRIGDLGQSKLLNNLSDIMKTMQPGTPLYLPPEALKKGSAYTLKIDVFSLGVVALCIATQAAPTTDIMNIGAIPEITRRKEDLDRLEAKHPLEGVISACLQDDPNLRPDVCFIDDHLGVLVDNGRLFNKLEESLSEQRKELMDLKKLYNLQKKELADSKSKIKVQETKCQSHLQTIERQTKELDVQKQALDEEQEAKQHQQEEMLRKVSSLEAKLKEKEVEMQSRICLLEKTFRDESGQLKGQLQTQEFECQSHLQTIERQKKELNVQNQVLDEEQKEKQLLREEMARRVSNLEAKLKMEHDNYEKDVISIEETLAIQQQKWDELRKLSTQSDAFDRNTLLEGDVRELRKRLATYKSRLESEFNQLKQTTKKQQQYSSERKPFSQKPGHMKDSHELFEREHKIGHSQSEIGYKQVLDQLCPRVDQTHSLVMSTYNYIKVSGLSEAISTEDIVAHFQTAECGGGTVTEVIIVGEHKSIRLVRIEGIRLDPSSELFKREHKIGHCQSELKVEMAPREPSPDQRQKAAYKIGTPRGTTSSVPAITHQLPPPPHISLSRPDPTPIVCLDSEKGTSNISFLDQPISKSSNLTQVDATDTAVHSDTKRPTTQPSAEASKLTHISSNTEEQTPSYIIVSGLTDSISTEDIVAHFQTARCGGGTVTEVIHLEQNKSRALVGISGIGLKPSHKLFKGKHKIGKCILHVETTSTPPTPEQRWNAVYSIGQQPGTTPPSPATGPPFSTNQPTRPPSSTNQPTQPPSSTNQKTRPPYSTNQLTGPPSSTNQPTRPPSTNQLTQPPFSTNQQTRPPVSTNQPTRPPSSINQPSDTLESSKHFTRQGSTSVDVASPIQLRRGGLTDHQADAYVNTAHHRLNLHYGAVAQSLLRSGGPVLHAECNQYISQHGNVPVWGYATTGGGNLGCKHIIHAVGTNYDGPGGSAEKGMERMLSNIMAECDRLGVSSVAFPAIGTDVLRFPDDTVAKTMIQTISTYLRKHPSTSVKQVLLVIFEDRTYKAFQSVMQTSTSVPTPSYTPGAVQQPGQSLYDHADMSHFEEQGGHHSFTNPPPAAGQHAVLQSFTCNRVAIDIVHGDITEEDCDGLVSTSSHDLKLLNFGVMEALLKKGGPELQRDCTSAAQRHGNLSSSKVIVTGAGRPGGLKCRKILHVLAPKKPDGLCKIVKEVLKKADGERLSVVALPAIGTGAHGFSAEQAAEGICDAIVEFSKGSHEYVNHIKVVLFQEKLYSSFSTAFAKAGDKKGIAKIAKRAWNYTKEVFGSISRGDSSELYYDAQAYVP